MVLPRKNSAADALQKSAVRCDLSPKWERVPRVTNGESSEMTPVEFYRSSPGNLGSKLSPEEQTPKMLQTPRQAGGNW